jgi:hypothetical protein
MSSVPSPTTTPAARKLVPAWILQLDPWEAATAVFVFTVTLAGNHFGGLVLQTAGSIISMSVICEFAMAWTAVALGRSVPSGNWWRILPRLILALAIYVGCVTMFVWKARAFYLIPQALWILAGRIRPRRGVSLMSDQNLRRFTTTGIVGVVLVFAHWMVIGFAAIVADKFGLAIKTDGMTIAPPWIYAVVWGAYYLELAYLVPRIDGRSKQQTFVESSK